LLVKHSPLVSLLLADVFRESWGDPVYLLEEYWEAKGCEDLEIIILRRLESFGLVGGESTLLEAFECLLLIGALHFLSAGF